MNYIIVILISYIIGSFPTSYLITKFVRKIDIRNYGSCNPGATNVFRVVGTIPGIITLLFDFSKGLIPVILGNIFFKNIHINILIGLFTIIGHNWSVFLKFKGGKGVATGAGVSFGLIPVEFFIGIIIFLSVFLLTRYVSLSSISAAILIPVLCWLTNKPVSIKIFFTVVGLIIVLRHKDNIKRLLTKTEHKIRS